MKPLNIILVRHGQSEGNVNKEIYGKKPDYALELTKFGKDQAKTAGDNIFGLVGCRDPIQFYVSPFWRTRQTYEIIEKSLPANHNKFYEDPRLREQEWGHLKARYSPELEVERDTYGHFYYRFPDGESCADVFDRISDFLNTMHRDFEKVNYPRNVVIVTHGMTMRLFLMRWFHMSVEEFELLHNPPNCGMYILSLDNKSGKYDLFNEPEKYEKRQHPYQYEWNKL